MYFWLVMAAAAVLIVSGLIIVVRRPRTSGDPRLNGTGSILIGVALILGFAAPGTAGTVAAVACFLAAIVLFAWSLIVRRRAQQP